MKIEVSRKVYLFMFSELFFGLCDPILRLFFPVPRSLIISMICVSRFLHSVPGPCSLIHSSDYIIQYSDSAVFCTVRVLWSYPMIVINIHFSMCPEIFWCSSEEREPSETVGLDRWWRLGFHPARLNVTVVPCAHLPTSAGCRHWALCEQNAGWVFLLLENKTFFILFFNGIWFWGYYILWKSGNHRVKSSASRVGPLKTMFASPQPSFNINQHKVCAGVAMGETVEN